MAAKGTNRDPLGSAMERGGTLGPAVLWRMDAQIGAPRYPWRFREGTLIRGVGDVAWWASLRKMHKKIVRLPTIIGNYHSRPADQAEFRALPYDEQFMMRKVGYSRM
jgi:hypothetical protein